MLRRNRRKLGTGTKGKGKEPERNLEKGLEVVSDTDVEMTLQ